MSRDDTVDARQQPTPDQEPAASSAPLSQPSTGGPMLETLFQLIERIESDPAPQDEHHFREPFHALGRALHEQEVAVPPELTAEEIAFSVHAHDRQDLSGWGLYFGPFMRWSTASGDSIDTPPLAMMTPEVLAYWRKRALESRHPAMRARYADLLWEMPKKLGGSKPDSAMARVAIDAYLEAVESRRYEHEVTAVDKAERALDLSLSLGDARRVERARDVLLALEDDVADDDLLGLWGFCFDTLVEPPNKRIPLPTDTRDRLVDAMEQRLNRLSTGPSSGPYHPVGAEAAALRLANYYRRQGRQDDVARVLRTYGDAVKKMQGTAPPLLVSHSLEQLYEQFTAFGLHQDADALNEAIRIAGEESLNDMKQSSHTVQIPSDKVEKYYEAMLAGTANEVLRRIAVHFVPRRDELEAQLRDLAKKAPLSYMMTRSIKDDDGRTVAYVGGLESDLEGQLVSHISQHMQLSVPWLRETFARGVASGLLSQHSLLEFSLVCPLFAGKRRPIIEAALKAYTSGDSMVAIHMLVPQLEQAIRQLATLVGAPVYTQRRGGGLYARTLDDLLRDGAIAAALTDDLVTYLRVLFTDARGWNVRNNVCHGLAPVSALTMPVADRVLHAMLVLALVRQDASASENTSGSNEGSA
jgi:hypothetical protein